MRMIDWIAASIAVLLALPVGLTCLAEEPKQEAAATKSEGKAARPKITIAKETTYITEPLGTDGYPDYVAALNRRYSEGVTPENNAAIPFWQAFGPKGIDQKVRKRYFGLLGIPELPEEGEYFVSLDEFLAAYKGWKQPMGETPEGQTSAEEAEEQFTLAQRKPWSKEEYPVIAAWLEKNERPLQILVTGLQRPRFYLPIVARDGDSTVHIDLALGVREGRAAIRQVIARAMLRVKNGDTAAAWKDTLAGYRFARLYGQRPLLIDRLVAMTLEGCADTAAAVISQQENTSSAQAREFQLQFRALPAMLPAREVWDFGERVYSLDYLLDIAVNKEHAVAFKSNEFLSSIYSDEQKKEQKALKSLTGDTNMDWDEVLRLENDWLSRHVEAAEQPTLAKRLEMLAKLDEDAAKAAPKATEQVLSRRWWTIDKTAPAVKARRLVDILHGPGPFGAMWKNMLVAEERFKTRQDLTFLAFALAGYRYDHQSYPKKLNDLEPKYIDAVPKDQFADGELHYKSDDGGYLLYSVGANGKDDGGRNFLENYADDPSSNSATEEEKSYDDIAIRSPRKKNSEQK